MKCSNHNNIDANGMCTQCNRLYCNDCLVDVGGKNVCKTCLSQGQGNPKQDTPPTVVIHNNNTNTNANVNKPSDPIGAVVACCCILIFIGAMSG